MRRYNEVVEEMVVADDGRPARWRWRGRWYACREVLEHWVTTADRWLADTGDPELGLRQVEHWIVTGLSSWGSGPVELSREVTSGEWRVVTIVADAPAEPEHEPDRSPIPAGYSRRVWIELPREWGQQQLIQTRVQGAGHRVDKLMSPRGEPPLLIFRITD